MFKLTENTIKGKTQRYHARQREKGRA